MNTDKPHPYGHRPMVNPEVSAYRSSRGSPLEIRDGQLLNDFDSTQHSTTGVSMPELLFGRPIRTKLPISKSSTSKMRCEIMTVREKKKGRCMQTAKGINACEGEIQEGDKVLLRPEKENKLSSRHTNSKANGI